MPEIDPAFVEFLMVLDPRTSGWLMSTATPDYREEMREYLAKSNFWN